MHLGSRFHTDTNSNLELDPETGLLAPYNFEI